MAPGTATTAAVEERVFTGAVAVRPLKTAEIVADHLRTQIVAGDLSAGQALPSEGQLMDIFGVSRASLREALRILEVERFIDVQRGAHGGPVVRPLSLETLVRHTSYLLAARHLTAADILDTRLQLEPPLFAAAAEHDAEETARRLRQLSAAIRAALSAGQVRVAARALTALHDDGGTGPMPLLALLCGVLLELSIMHGQIINIEADELNSTSCALDELANLISQRQADEAADRWRRHLMAFRHGNDAAGQRARR